jgi:hypothetical protein
MYLFHGGQRRHDQPNKGVQRTDPAYGIAIDVQIDGPYQPGPD